MKLFARCSVPHLIALGLAGLSLLSARGATYVYLLDVPDYDWYAGCFGTANGNLFGYWDRHGFPNFYTGPTGGGVAPLHSKGVNAGIQSMWASKAGVDGRPTDQPGHMDDYYVDYESPAADPYVTLGRAEHTPDCIGDFIGLSQKKWTNMADECGGNIDAYSFVYWDKSGKRRTSAALNEGPGGSPVDIQLGLRQWTRYCGYEAEVFSQLTDFNPTISAGTGFTFQHFKAEIDAGYPVLFYLQNFTEYYRTYGGANLNPPIHGVLAFGYAIQDDGSQWVRYRSSWGDGSEYVSPWNAGNFLLFPIRGVIGYRPKPKVTSVSWSNGRVTLHWDGPSSQLYDVGNNTTTQLHSYQVQRSTSLHPAQFVDVGSPTTGRSLTIDDCCGGTAFFRVKLR